MITYGFSQQGKSHIQKGVVCQDSNSIELLKNNWYVLVVADGVGSARHSEDGSRLAVKAVSDFCKKNILPGMGGDEIIDILRTAYQLAYRQIELFCQEMNGSIEDYDTTLTTAIYTGTDLYFGHAGDGGIIIKDWDGCYEMITVPQKGMDGISVRPLRAGLDSWDFGIVDKKVSAVLLATDGMLDTLLPPLLNINQMQFNPMIQDKKMNVYVTLAEFFMNADCIYNNRAIRNPNHFLETFLLGDVTNEQFNRCIENAYSHMFDSRTARSICVTVEQYNYSTWKMDKVTDDRTIVCAMNDKWVISNPNPEYYAEPNWKVLQKQFDMIAYPSLYEKNASATTEGDLETATGDYAKMSLDMTGSDGVLKNINHLEQGRIGADNTNVSEQMDTSVRSRSASKATKEYQKSSKKKSTINIVCVLLTILVLGCVFTGLKIADNKFNFTDKIFAKINKNDVDEEKKKPDKEKKDDRREIVSSEDTQSGLTEDGSEDLENEDDSMGQGTETIVDSDSKGCLTLFGIDYPIPCKLEQLLQDCQELKQAENNEHCYILEDNKMQMTINTIDIQEDSETNMEREESEDSSLNESMGADEIIKSINISWLVNSFNEENTKICFDESYIALGMNQEDFQQNKQELEEKLPISWEESQEDSGSSYQFTYDNVEYTVVVRNNIVKEITLIFEQKKDNGTE